MNNNASASMTQKEALELLYAQSKEGLRPLLSECAFEEYDQRRHQLWQAYLLLVQIVYGPRKDHQLSFPCSLCHERYAEKRMTSADLQPEAMKTPPGYVEPPQTGLSGVVPPVCSAGYAL